MSGKKATKGFSQKTVNIIILCLVLCLFAYAGIQLSRNLAPDKVSTQRTQTVTDSTYAYLDGYIFRDEVRVSANGVVDYLVRDGEKVGVGGSFAEVYSAGAMKSEERASAQNELNILSDRIYLLGEGLGGSFGASGLADIKNSISSSYYAYIDALTSGNFSSADKSGEVLLKSLVNYSAVTLGEATKNQAEELMARKTELLSRLGGSKQTLFAEDSFNFFKSTDGYEAVFHSSLIDSMTPSQFEALISAEGEKTDNGVIGRKTYSAKWYLAVPADEATHLAFKVGESYDVGFIDEDGVSLQMKLEDIRFDEDEPNSAFMLFSCFDLAMSGNFSRHQNIKIHLSDTSGYRIPTESLQSINGVDGVYILVGNVVEFRRVAVIGKGNGYYIVSTNKADSDEGNLSEIPYLNINDMIVTSGRDLYDGKQLE